jgi:hypothetical protein
LEDRTLLTVNLLSNYSGLNFSQSGGYVPPDTCGAAGTANYVETVNQTVGIYTPKGTGTSLVSDSFSDFWYVQGKLKQADGGSFLSDPIVTWDEQVQRFIVGDQDVDPNTLLSNFDIAVSKSASPATLTASDWNFFQVSTTESGFDADYPGNFGWNHDAFVFTLNMFGTITVHTLVTSININDLVNGNPITPFKNDYNNNFSLRPTVMHDSVANDPMWFVTEHGDNKSIDVIKMSPVLSSSPTFTTTNLAVNSYSTELPPLQPNGQAVTTNIDSRIMKAAEYNNTIVATHHVSKSGTEDDARWYSVDVSSGTPTLKDQGSVSAGNNNYLYYPSIDINASGDFGMTYMQSGTAAGQFMSMYVTGRTPSDAAGTMETPVLVQAGLQNYTDFANPHRAGDLSGINLDSSDGTFFAANEWADKETGGANWGTAIGHFSMGGNEHYTITAATSTPTAGSPFSITVTAVDANGNTDPNYRGTVHFTTSDTQSPVLPADYTFTATDAGVHTFTNGVTLKTAGGQTVTGTDTVTSSINGSVSVTVGAAAASTLIVSGFPSPVNAGTAGTVTVTAKDPYNNTATGYTGTINFTSSDGQASLPVNYTFTGADAGVHTFTNGVTLKTAGTQSITATDTVTSSITGTQSGITVNAIAASTYTVTGFPSPSTAGVAGTFTVTAKDPYGNTATSYRGTVKFSSSDGKATLSNPYTFTASDSGVHTFTNGATLKTAGTQSITATDSHNSSITGSQTGITVVAAAASKLSVTGFPTPVTAGTAGTFSVTALDAFGNVATSYGGTVKFSSTDPKAVLPANYTFVSADNGVHTFTNGATLKTAGTRAISATDTVKPSITGTQTGIVVNAAATSQLAVSGFPSAPTAGTAGTVTVTAEDPYGNKTTGYLGTVKFTSSDPQAVLPTNYTFVPSDNGSHTFTNGVTLKTAGRQSITATDTVTSSITGSQTVNVSPAAASTLVVAGFPSPTKSGVAHNFTVTAKDPYGNIATGYRGTVTFSSSDGSASLPANYPFVAADHGMHTFSATLKTVGTQSITATDTVTSSITGTQSNITVTSTVSILLVAGFGPGSAGSPIVPSSTQPTSVPAPKSPTQAAVPAPAAPVDSLFRDWSAGAVESNGSLELLKTQNAIEQLAYALLDSPAW